MSLFGWIVKNGGKLYCQGHSKLLILPHARPWLQGGHQKKKNIFADLAISSDGGRGLGALASHELLDSVQSRVYHLGPLRGSVTVCDSVSYERRSSGAGESF